MPFNPKRIYLRLIDDPPKDGSADEQLTAVRQAVEDLTPVRWESGYPQVHGRGGWSAIFYVDEEPDEETYGRWFAKLEQSGFRPCI